MSTMGRAAARPFTIALLGAESTGKTALAAALSAHALRHGIDAAVVPEQLRAWCDTHGRTPRRDEQAPLAQAQRAAIEDAARHLMSAAAPGAPSAWLIADTTPLMTAIYSQQVFGDDALLAEGLAFHRLQVDVTLLLGLDLPWVPDGLQRDGPQVRAPVDARLRHALAGAALPHAVVYGQGPARLRAALRAISKHTRAAFEEESKTIANSEASTPATGTKGQKSGTEGPTEGRWQAWCECCGDPDCELRLFRGLASD